LVSVEADLGGDFFVEHPGETQQDDRCSLREALADRARLAEFFQQLLLSFSNLDLRGRPWHWSISCLKIERLGKIRDFQVSC
jgi:hypothetical protein